MLVLIVFTLRKYIKMHLFSVKVHSRNPEKVIYIYHYKQLLQLLC